MKSLACFTILLLMNFSSFSQDKNEMSPDVTTYYFIRHAEKDRSNPSEQNPHLMQKGLDRAQQWSNILKHVKFDAVYSTNYHRTLETGKPTAERNQLKITSYDPHKVDYEAFKKETKGKVVLIVGHSNTIPAFVNAMIRQKKYEDMDDSNNGNLYIVTLIDGKASDQLLSIN